MRICVFLTVLFLSINVWAANLAEIKVYGVSQVKSENADMWDKKNHAVKNAKEKATYKLAAKALKPEVYAEARERLKKEILPYSNRYLISSTTKSHGLEQDGDYKAYHAQVVFKYSLENFRNLLKSKGFSADDLQRHKVVSFIEVLDLTAVKSYSWWRDRNPKLHPVLKPLQAKLNEALKENGYELLPVRLIRNVSGMKDIASSLGAQYYVNGTVRIERVGSGYKVKGGAFNFHEALSQKLVSKVDLEKFGADLDEKNSARGTASVERKKDLLKDAFTNATQKMNSSENVENLSQGLAQISFYGVNNPVDLSLIKKAIKTNLKSHVSSLVERRIENGKVSFYARTSLSPTRLLSMMNSRSAGLGNYRGVLKEDGKSLAFRVQ